MSDVTKPLSVAVRRKLSEKSSSHNGPLEKRSKTSHGLAPRRLPGAAAARTFPQDARAEVEGETDAANESGERSSVQR